MHSRATTKPIPWDAFHYHINERCGEATEEYSTSQSEWPWCDTNQNAIGISRNSGTSHNSYCLSQVRYHNTGRKQISPQFSRRVIHPSLETTYRSVSHVYAVLKLMEHIIVSQILKITTYWWICSMAFEVDNRMRPSWSLLCKNSLRRWKPAPRMVPS